MITTRATTTASCPARAALAGNPSDGHGGAVVATVVDSVAATATVTAADHFTIDGTTITSRSIDEFDERIRAEGCGKIQPLVPATLAAMHRYVRAELRPVDVDVSTTIPRSVGLAGSSAIVIATMRALVAHHRGAAWADRLDADPSLVASVALAAERDVLGITAGLQDRVVQSIGGTVAMEFGSQQTRDIGGLEAGTYRHVGPLPGGMFVAYRAGAAADSGWIHAALDGDAPAVRRAMSCAAEAARDAVIALESGDVAGLATAMDATFEQRQSVMPLDPAHIEMIGVARAHGAAANYTGSGGAIVVLPGDAQSVAGVRSALALLPGCSLLDVT